MSFWRSGPRWPIIGPTCASSTSGSTSVGPGRKNRPNGGSSTFGTVAVSGIVAPVIAVGSGPRNQRQGQEGWYPVRGGACHGLYGGKAGGRLALPPGCGWGWG